MLQLRDVEAGYGETLVLRDLTLLFPESAVVALLGPNGAGKTSCLRVASGLLRPWRGEVLLEGRNVVGVSPHELTAAGLCHIPEGRGIFRSLSVQENLMLYAPPGMGQEGIERAVDAFPVLGERLAQSAGTLSGGEQQMLALARAYATNPRFVLLDEVSMGLAPRIIDAIFEFLQRLAAEGAALLLVEQYVTRALEIADYVYLLNRGRVAFAGEPAELDADTVFQEYVGTEL